MSYFFVHWWIKIYSITLRQKNILASHKNILASHKKYISLTQKNILASHKKNILASHKKNYFVVPHSRANSLSLYYFINVHFFVTSMKMYFDSVKCQIKIHFFNLVINEPRSIQNTMLRWDVNFFTQKGALLTQTIF